MRVSVISSCLTKLPRAPAVCPAWCRTQLWCARPCRCWMWRRLSSISSSVWRPVMLLALVLTAVGSHARCICVGRLLFVKPTRHCAVLAGRRAFPNAIPDRARAHASHAPPGAVDSDGHISPMQGQSLRGLLATNKRCATTVGWAVLEHVADAWIDALRGDKTQNDIIPTIIYNAVPSVTRCQALGALLVEARHSRPQRRAVSRDFCGRAKS